MHLQIRTCLAWLAINIFPLTTFADPASGNRHLAGADNPITFPYVLQILASFVAVVAFILFLAWLMRKSGRFGAANDRRIKVISSMSLGMREKIVLVNVDGVNIVVGVAPGQIRTLHVSPGDAQDNSTLSEGHEGFARFMGKFLN